jgi:DNA-binding transcriptional ArsR family regulator
LTALYEVTPNTRVRFMPAFAGALFATILLELSQMLFVTWIKTSVAYDIVYGAFAALPVFLAWIYLNWLAVLLGVVAAYLIQNVPTWLREAGEPETLAWDERERLVLACAALLASRKNPVSIELLAQGLEISPRLVHRPLDDLEDSGWISPVQDDRGQIIAYRANDLLRETTLAEIRRTLRSLGEISSFGARQRGLHQPPAWMAVLEPLERESDRPFESITPIQLSELLYRAERQRQQNTS